MSFTVLGQPLPTTILCSSLLRRREEFFGASFQFSGDESCCVVTNSFIGSIEVWDLHRQIRVCDYQLGPRVESLVSKDGSFLFTRTTTELTKWQLGVTGTPLTVPLPESFHSPSGPVWWATSNDGSLLVVVDAEVFVFDAATLARRTTLNIREHYEMTPVAMVRPSIESPLIVCIRYDPAETTTVGVIDLVCGDCLWRNRYSLPYQPIEYAGDRYIFLVSETADELLVLDLLTGREAGRMPGFQYDGIWEFGSNGQLLARIVSGEQASLPNPILRIDEIPSGITQAEASHAGLVSSHPAIIWSKSSPLIGIIHLIPDSADHRSSPVVFLDAKSAVVFGHALHHWCFNSIQGIMSPTGRWFISYYPTTESYSTGETIAAGSIVVTHLVAH